MAKRQKDDLDEFVAARSKQSPGFDSLVEAASLRREILRDLSEIRKALGLPRTVVAARMGTSESAVARLECGEIDPRFTTVERFAAAVGKRVEWKLTDA